MFNFNIRETSIYSAILWNPIFKTANIVKRIALYIFFGFIFIFFYGLLFAGFKLAILRIVFGISVLSIDTFIVCWLMNRFFVSKLQKPEPDNNLANAILNPESYNLANFFSFGALRALLRATNFSEMATANHILYGLVKLSDSDPDSRFVFYRLMIDTKEIRQSLKEIFSKDKKEETNGFSEDFKAVIIDAMKVASKKGKKVVEPCDLLLAVAQNSEFLKDFLIKYSLKAEDVENIGTWIDVIKKNEKRAKEFWSAEYLRNYGTLAKSWTAGYTINLDKYSADLTKVINGRTEQFVGHRDEIGIAERILTRRENNNVLLVGDPGTGKKNIILNLAKKCLLGEALPELNYKRFVEINMSGLLAEMEGKEEIESTLNMIFQEAYSAGNVVLVIEDFDTYVGQVPRPGVIDISGVLASFLALRQFRFIGICSYDGLHKNIEKNPAFLSLFGKVEVKEMGSEETLLMLEAIVPSLEKKYKIFISYPAMRRIVDLTTKYMPNEHFPEKAIRMLDETAVYVATSAKDKVVLPGHADKVVAQKTEIPVGEMAEKEKGILLNLESLIHERLINQEEAVKEISSALRRSRAQISVRKGPMGTFLFLGPTGVGKTETAKAMAAIYFGSEEKMIRLDMSEFQSINDIPRLIGTQNQPGLLSTPVKENPFSLVLLDEIEKADINIRNLFLQVLDEGYLKDGNGNKVSFENTIIIATSNAGYKIILESIKDNTKWADVKQKIMDYIFAERIFPPEFINRFDGFVVFSPLNKQNLMDIAQLTLVKLNKNLKEKGIQLLITEELKGKIVELGYNPIFGAREMRRVVQDKIENKLAEALLSGSIKRGNNILIDPKTFNITINPNSQG